MKHCIVHFSPAGSTGRAAESIGAQLAAEGEEVRVFDLTRGMERVLEEMAVGCGREEPCCLWIGSPVYCDHAVPPVEAFIERIVPGANSWSVPFVTWGGVTSGLALPELALLLAGKGYTPLGAAKIMAVHSSMFGAEKPLAAGRPDAGDFSLLQELVDGVRAKLAAPEPAPLALEKLDYLSPRLKADARGKSLAAVKAAMPAPAADPELCNGCGVCAESCPVQAITMEERPVVGAGCILCMQCIRQCPESAFPMDHEAVAGRIRGMAEASDEPKLSAVFL